MVFQRVLFIIIPKWIDVFNLYSFSERFVRMICHLLSACDPCCHPFVCDHHSCNKFGKCKYNGVTISVSYTIMLTKV